MITSHALNLPGIRHGFFTRQGGHSIGLFNSLNCGLGSGDDLATVRKNRNAVSQALGLGEDTLVTGYQVHSADVAEVDLLWGPDARPQVDGLVTRKPGVALGVLTADCGPILFADAGAGVIGGCHAGWKGAVTGITDSTINAMEKLGASRNRMVAVLGPMISQKAYEVGPEFPKPFLAQDEGHARFFIPSAKAGHFMFDLPGYIRQRLEQAGVATIHDTGLCTYADEARFFSYRRATHRGEKDYGRLVAAIALAP